ncbi:tir-nbs resistance protein [Hibiscus syriacus]|uniref:Tir-nbs resistance protein n=1 Tax=Hibiscus syriacus TaxID=106335 RepID=A0A6A3ANT6_HIBSY|nr:tir-nbs resistance protein [Hibiscus syriacus]
MLALNTTIEEEMLEHIRDTKTPKEAWDTFVTLFSKKNDTRLQLLENELLLMPQHDMTIAPYFHKVKSICHEILELDLTSPIRETRVKRISIHGLRPEYRGFVATVQGWPTKPSLVEFENLLVGQEAMAKKMGGVSLKGEEEALYINQSRGHVSYSKISVTVKKSMLKGLLQLDVRTNTIYAGCQYGKELQLPYDESKFKAKEPLELIHSNVFGPVKQQSISDMQYMVTFIDDFSRKKNCHLTEICRSMLHAKSVAGRFWAEAMRTAAFVINRLPRPSGKTYNRTSPTCTCNKKDWNLWQMGVKNAFLHGELDPDIYMTQPMGFQSQDHPEYVCKLRKALYELKQAPRTLYGKITEFLTKSGYSVTPADSSLFVKANEGGNCKLVGYCDADYAGDHDTRRSTTGYMFTLGSGTISWCSKRQPTVSLSTTEVEYRAAAMAAQESTWMIQLMNYLHQPVDYVVLLYCDNQSTIQLAENPVFHARTKHVEVHYHFVREKVLQEEIEMRQVKRDEQIADLFTKSLSVGKFEHFRRQFGVIQRMGANIEGEC